MRFTVQVQHRQYLTNGKPTHTLLKQLGKSIEGAAAGKMASKLRREFNAAKHLQGRHQLQCVGTSCHSSGAITLFVETTPSIDAREEACRLAAGGAPKKNIPRSRHH